MKPWNIARYRRTGSRLLLAEGVVQKSPEGVIYLVAHTLIDHSADLKQLSGDAVPRSAAISGNSWAIRGS